MLLKTKIFKTFMDFPFSSSSSSSIVRTMQLHTDAKSVPLSPLTARNSFKYGFNLNHVEFSRDHRDS